MTDEPKFVRVSNLTTANGWPVEELNTFVEFVKESVRTGEPGAVVKTMLPSGIKVSVHVPECSPR